MPMAAGTTLTLNCDLSPKKCPALGVGTGETAFLVPYQFLPVKYKM